MVGQEGLRWCHKGKGKLSQSLNNLLLHTITLFSKQSWVDIYVNNYCKLGFFYRTLWFIAIPASSNMWQVGKRV